MTDKYKYLLIRSTHRSTPKKGRLHRVDVLRHRSLSTLHSASIPWSTTRNRLDPATTAPTPFSSFSSSIVRRPLGWALGEPLRKRSAFWPFASISGRPGRRAQGRFDPSTKPSGNGRYLRAPGEGGAFQWVQVPPGERSSRKQPEQSWR